MRVVQSPADLLTESGPAVRAVVMTMGALHAGHSEMIRAARREADHVTVTLFVNPLQFGENEDLARYPRTLDADLQLCESLGVNTVFAPPEEQMYLAQPTVTVHPGPLGEQLEGAVRPGHFRGVLTVVLKLLHLTAPDIAVFGEKDYQQLALVRAMVRDLNVPVEIRGVPTVRDSDGLALSSRNAYLSADERVAALAVPRALAAGSRQQDVAAIEAAAREALAELTVDYAVVRSPEMGEPQPGPGRLLVAARVGTTRLLDNAPVEVRL